MILSNSQKFFQFTNGSEWEDQTFTPKLFAQNELSYLKCDLVRNNNAICQITKGIVLIIFVEYFRKLDYLFVLVKVTTVSESEA